MSAIYTDDFDVAFPGPPGPSQADILRRTGQYGVLPTDTDEQVMAKLNNASQTVAVAAALAAQLSADKAKTSEGLAGVSAMSASNMNNAAQAALASILAAIDGETIAPTLTVPIATRALMAAITDKTLPVYLTETGREGTFIWRGGDQSASVALDTYQALYVSPASAASGASGAWVRVLPLSGLPGANRYNLSWWGAVPGSPSYSSIMSAAVALVPVNSTIVLGGYEHPLSAAVYIHTEGVVFEGAGDSTRIVCDDPTRAYWTGGGNNLITGTNSRTGVRNMRLLSCNHMVEAGGSFALGFGGGYRPLRSVPVLGYPLADPVCDNITFEGGSEGVVFLGDNSANSQDAFLPVLRPRVVGCRFINHDYQAISLFGTDDSEVSGCYFRCAQHRKKNGASFGFACVFRILGSKDYRIHHNFIHGLGYDEGDNRSAIFGLFGMSQGNTRRQNRGGMISNIIAENYRYLVFLQETRGTVLFENIVATNPDDATTAGAIGPISCDVTPNLSPPFTSNVDCIKFRNVVCRGVSRGWHFIGPIRRPDVENCELVWGGKPVNGNVECGLWQPFQGDKVDYCRFVDNRFIWPNGASEQYFAINLPLSSDGVNYATAEVHGNMVPEGDATFAVIGAGGGGKLIIARGTPAIVPNGSLKAVGEPGNGVVGTNLAFPPGTYAASMAN
jgi:hypothetical protein